MAKKSTSPDNSDPDALNTNATVPDAINSDIGESGASNDDPVTKGDGPMLEELTGRASYTGEDLVSLMANDTAAHLTDGFRRGHGDDPEADPDTDDDEEVDLT